MSIVSTGNRIISNGLTSNIGVVDNVRRLAGKLNKIAIQETKGDVLTYTFPKATAEDLKRLTSKSIKDSYKRVTWTNPEDNKVYHILEEGREGGKVQVRILDKDGEFLKNAELEPKNIVIFDTFFSRRGVSHGDKMEIFIKRFNPFANVEKLAHKKNIFEFLKYRHELPIELEHKRFNELADKMDKGKKVDYISISEATLFDAEEVMHKSGAEQQKYMAQSANLKIMQPVYERILSKGVRILEAAGNDSRFSKEVVNDRLAIEGIEGVGSLQGGKIAHDSCSRNSIFTQHYERRNFIPKPVKDENGKVLGINITGLSGVDVPVNWRTKTLIGMKMGGTSYATPIRVAKLALNDMMKGII